MPEKQTEKEIEICISDRYRTEKVRARFPIYSRFDLDDATILMRTGADFEKISIRTPHVPSKDTDIDIRFEITKSKERFNGGGKDYLLGLGRFASDKTEFEIAYAALLNYLRAEVGPIPAQNAESAAGGAEANANAEVNAKNEADAETKNTEANHELGDPELSALKAMWELIAPMDSNARQRVFAYLENRSRYSTNRPYKREEE